MTALIVGGSGATGKLLVQQLLKAGYNVKLILRDSSVIPDSWNENDNITIIRANVLELTKDEMAKYVKDCEGIASCLGHNLTFKGIYGKPRRLVADTVKLLCDAIAMNKPQKPVKLVLMNTVGNRNKDLNEPLSIGHKLLLGLMRLLLPPQSDNEKAADYLRINIGQKNTFINWVAVRPDSLLDEKEVTEYVIYPSPIRSALFNPGKTSRINVAHFMARIIENDSLCEQWKGQMPVIYNQEDK